MVWTQNAYTFLEIGALTSIHNSQSHETSKTDQEILKLIVSLRTEKEKLGKGWKCSVVPLNNTLPSINYIIVNLMWYLPSWRIGISCRVRLLSCIPSAEVSANGKGADIRKRNEPFQSDGLRSDLLPFLQVLFLSKKEVEQMLDRPLECTVFWDWQCLFERKGNTVRDSMCLSRNKHTLCPVYNPSPHSVILSEAIAAIGHVSDCVT